MAASILSLGMLTARAFWMTRRRAGFDAGSGPPDLTAMVMSFAIRANCFAMRFHRANIVCFLTSNMRPMPSVFPAEMPRLRASRETAQLDDWAKGAASGGVYPGILADHAS